MYGSVTKQRVWRIRPNKEPREAHEIADLVADIKWRILEMLGHEIGMDQTRVSNNIFD
jgi:hypothetical protein